MSDITNVQTTAQSEEEMKGILAQIVAELHQIHSLMRLDQEKIERYKAESKVITEHTDGMLSRLRLQLDTLDRIA